MAQARIRKEMQDLSNYDTFQCRTDYGRRINEVLFVGPETSPYQGMGLKVIFIYPRDYPFKPPVIRFDPPIFHPNVSETGRMTVPSLTGDDWSPATTTRMSLLTILSLLHEPFICNENLAKNDKGKEEMNEIVNNECVNQEALRLWKQSFEDFKQIVLVSYDQ